MSNEKIDPYSYRIVPIGSGPVGWAIERDGTIWTTGPSVEGVGAYLDAIQAGASECDAEDIANVIEQRPRPSYEERLAVFKPTGRPSPSHDPFSAASTTRRLDRAVVPLPFAPDAREKERHT